MPARTRSALMAVFSLVCAAGLTACGSPTPTAYQRQANPAAAQAQSPAAAADTFSAPATDTPAAPGAAGSDPASAATSASSDAARPAVTAQARVSVPEARLPGYTVESWAAQSPGPARDVTGHPIELNECATMRGALTWQQTSYAGSGGDSAILETYTFSANSAAEAAYSAVVAGMRSCQATSRALQASAHLTPDAVSRQTAVSADAVAFARTWTGVQGVSAPGPQTNHLYLAMSGMTVLVLHFDELAADNAAAPYDVRDDPGVLSMLINVLAH
jgi:hypothetical protein